MDERTRFQLVSVITKTREVRKAFRKSKEVGGKKPMLMVTDVFASYRKAFNGEFYDHHNRGAHGSIRVRERL